MNTRSTPLWLWLLILLPIAAGMGYWYGGSHGRSGGAAKTAAAKAMYHCPMHPNYTSDHPGDCPICGMSLVPVKQDEERKPTAGNAAQAEPTVPGQATVYLSPEKQQLLGVKLVTVARAPLSREIRATGQVTADETRIDHVHAKVGGWVEKLYVNFTGMAVKKGQPLLSIYSPDLVATQEEYLLALKARARLRKSSFVEISRSGEDLVEGARRRLKLWDISDTELRRIEVAGQPIKAITLYAPSSGYVMEKAVLEGQQIDPSTTLLIVADLSSVWLQVDFYEQDAAAVHVGDRASVTANAYPGHSWAGAIDYIFPTVDPQTRTLRARLRLANRGGLLKPGMYAEVSITESLGAQLTVPDDAVIDSGTRQIVFVARPDGHFAARQVTVGARTEDRRVILGGLRPGEKVVSNGNFLIDSESRLKSALEGMSTPATPAPEPSGAEHAGHGT